LFPTVLDAKRGMSLVYRSRTMGTQGLRRYRVPVLRAGGCSLSMRILTGGYRVAVLADGMTRGMTRTESAEC